MMSSFRKLPACDYCQFYRGGMLTPCLIHPDGVQADYCLDFREDESATRCWEQFLGVNWVGGAETEPLPASEESSYYNGELITGSTPRWSHEEQAELLNWHPMFTRRCPACEMPIEPTVFPEENWECPDCGWKDMRGWNS